MEIRKFRCENWGGDAITIGTLGQTILALEKVQHNIAPEYKDTADFQHRCSTAIIALGNQILESIESRYAPETRKFKVTYNIRRSGVYSFDDVEASSEDEARRIAERKIAGLKDKGLEWLWKTEFDDAEITKVEEVNP